MKIVKAWVAPPPPWGASCSIQEGWRDACKALNIEFIEWKTHEETLQQVCDRVQPDIIFLDCGQQFDIPVYLQEHRCKIVVGVHQYPRREANVLFPYLAKAGYITTTTHLKWIEDLKPDLLYHSATQSALDRGWNGWRRLGYNVTSIPLAGNPYKFGPITDVPNWDSKPIDVSYIGGFTGEKIVGCFSFVAPCSFYAKTKIVGPGWPFNLEETIVSSERCNIIWNHSKIALSVQEDYMRWNQRYEDYISGELSERVYSAALSGALVICDVPATIKDIFKEHAKWFPAFNNPDEFHDFVKNTLLNPNDLHIINCREKQRAAVLAAHTYEHRIKNLLNLLGISYHAALGHTIPTAS